MKNISLQITKCFVMAIFALIVGIGISVTDAKAQSESVFKVNIPFKFVVAGRTFSAGQYRIGRLDQANPNVLILKDKTGTSRVIVQARPLDADSRDLGQMLTFDRYDDIFVLTGFRALGQTNQPSFAMSDLLRQKNAKLLGTVNLTGD